VRRRQNRNRNTTADRMLLVCVEHLETGVEIDLLHGVLRRGSAIIAQFSAGVEVDEIEYGDELCAINGRIAFADGSHLIISDGVLLPLSRCDLIGLKQDEIDSLLAELRSNADDEDDEEAQQ